MEERADNTPVSGFTIDFVVWPFCLTLCVISLPGRRIVIRRFTPVKIKALPALLLSFCILLPVLAQTKPATPAPPPQKPSDDQDEVVKITTNLVQVDAI